MKIKEKPVGGRPSFAMHLFMRLGFILIGLVALNIAVLNLLQGDLSYTNWWGGLASAPIVFVVALFTLYLGIFRFKELDKPFDREVEKHKPRKQFHF